MTFNLNAAMAEARGEDLPFDFDFGDDNHVLPPTTSLAELIEMDKNDVDPFEQLGQMLGAEQWAKLLASPARFDLNAYRAVMKAYREHGGVSEGESDASADSSTSTTEQ